MKRRGKGALGPTFAGIGPQSNMTLETRARIVSAQRAPGDSPADRTIPLIASTAAVDSHGEIVDQTGWNLERFLKNPAAFWQHDTDEEPIGFYRDVRVEDGALRASLVLYGADVSARAERIWQRYCQGGPIAFSVGFNFARSEVSEVDGEKIRTLFDNDLFEISVVTIGANPDAVASVRKAKQARAAKARRAPAAPSPTSPTAKSSAPAQKEHPMKLRDFLGSKNMTPEQCGAALGLDATGMTALMDGSVAPSDEQLAALADALDLDVDELVNALADGGATQLSDELPEVDTEEAAAAALLKQFGAKTFREAAIKHRAQLENKASAGTLAVRIATVEKSQAARERAELLDAARKSGRLTPAREKRSEKYIASLKSLGDLRCFLDVLEVVVSEGGDDEEPEMPVGGSGSKSTLSAKQIDAIANATKLSPDAIKRSAAQLAAKPVIR